jgi:hypothetical protein
MFKGTFKMTIWIEYGTAQPLIKPNVVAESATTVVPAET